MTRPLSWFVELTMTIHTIYTVYFVRMSSSTLVLIRHGQSQWNLENRFTGWTDVPLTDQGRSDAKACGEFLQQQGYTFDCVFTSRLMRANHTMNEVLEAMGLSDIEQQYDSALNERHYGDLQGLNKAETVEKHGKEQVQLWRRSYSTRPPNGESMEDCAHRTIPYFTQYILPHVIEHNRNVLVVAHGNSLRPIMKHLEDLEPEVVASLEVGLCTPYVYTFEGAKLQNKEILEVPGITTKGASLTEKSVSGGRI